MNLLELLKNWDQNLLIFVNRQLSNGFLDWLMPLITDLHRDYLFLAFAIPLILCWWFLRKGIHTVPIVLMTLACVGASDLITYRVLKPTFKRARSQAPVIVRSPSAGYSFPSNHAANNFAAARFLGLCYPNLSLPPYCLVLPVLPHK